MKLNKNDQNWDGLNESHNHCFNNHPDQAQGDMAWKRVFMKNLDSNCTDMLNLHNKQGQIINLFFDKTNDYTWKLMFVSKKMQFVVSSNKSNKIMNSLNCWLN